MLISYNNKDIINTGLIKKISKETVGDSFNIVFDDCKWEFKNKNKRDDVYSYIVENITKSIK